MGARLSPAGGTSGSSEYPALDGTLYWTLSFYLPHSDLTADGGRDDDAKGPLGKSFEADATLARLDKDMNAATRTMRDAIEPLFNDIADRTRQGVVLDRLLADGPRVSMAFDLPPQITWKTEGKRYRVLIPPAERLRPVEARRFWYLHSNGAMSWHVAFAVPYAEQLQAELEGGRVTTLYFLSILQKLAWPKECDAEGVDALTTDALLGMRIAPQGTSSDGNVLFWEQVEEWFAQDTVTIDRVYDRPEGQSAARTLPRSPCIEVPGLNAYEARSQIFLHDSAFFNLIQPKQRNGELVPRRERILDGDFRAYPERLLALAPDADGVRTLDDEFWKSMLAGGNLKSARNRTVKFTRGGKLAATDAIDRVFYLFLAGFNQNIIDWANQEASEVLDSLDPIYPASGEQEDEGFFIRYANPRSLITYVPRSRTLEVGNNEILTCPYAFLIHVLSMNNEFLTRQKEMRSFSVIDRVRGKFEELEAEPLNTGSGNVDHLARKTILTEVEQAINRLRIDSYEHFDRHLYANPFRYDTERDVFEEMDCLRGTSRLEIAHREALHALDEHSKDLNRLRSEEERAAETAANESQQAKERKLAALFGVIGLSGLGQWLFNIHDYLAAEPIRGLAPTHLADYGLLAIEGILLALVLTGIYFFFRK